MEQYTESVIRCKNSLKLFSAQFDINNSFLETKRIFISSCTENLTNFQPVTAGVILQDEVDRADGIAAEIDHAKRIVESLFQHYRKDEGQQFIPENGQQDEPIFLQWLDAIATLRHLYPKQRVPEQTIALCDIQSCVQDALKHLDQLYPCLSNVYNHMQKAKHEAGRICNLPYYAGFCINLWHLSIVDLSPFEAMGQTIWNLKMEILQKQTLIIYQQPRPILTKKDRPTSGGNLRDRKVTSRTDISVKLLNVYEIPNGQIPIQIRLINENEAQEIQRNNLNETMEFGETQIYRCDSSTPNTSPDNFITTDLQMLETGNTGTTSSVFEARVSNISVINVEKSRQRNGSNGQDARVIKKKFYFLITAKIQYMGSLMTTWVLSTPVILRTHSVQIQGALATQSWTKYFSDGSDNTQLRSYGKISEICGVLQAHFQEWTAYKADGENMASLFLNNDHLNFLIDMLFEHVCGEQSHISREAFIESYDVPLELVYDQKLEDRNFSFWSWFYKAACIFKKKYFRELWQKGHIKGFIGKPEAYSLLQKNDLRVGDFLIRFSQSVEAELCAVFVNHEKKVVINPLKLEKTTDENLKNSFLKEIYKHYWTGREVQEAFINVYPNISKQDAFPFPRVLDVQPLQRRRQGSVAPYVYDRPTIAATAY